MSVDTASHVDAVSPNDAERPVDAVRPVDAAGPGNATRPIDKTRSVDTTKPIGAARPADAAKSVDAARSVAGTNPNNKSDEDRIDRNAKSQVHLLKQRLSSQTQTCKFIGILKKRNHRPYKLRIPFM